MKEQIINLLEGFKFRVWIELKIVKRKRKGHFIHHRLDPRRNLLLIVKLNLIKMSFEIS